MAPSSSSTALNRVSPASDSLLIPTSKRSCTTPPKPSARASRSSTPPSWRAYTIPKRQYVPHAAKLTVLCLTWDDQLLPDGRVLISGSDPQTPGFPEETRVEVYIPPYLTDGRRQPSFTIPQVDWTYGGQYTFDVTLHEGGTDTMRVSLIAGACYMLSRAAGLLSDLLPSSSHG